MIIEERRVVVWWRWAAGCSALCFLYFCTHLKFSIIKEVFLSKFYHWVTCDYFPTEMKPAPRLSCSLTPREFNSYGARRGNDAVMTRGTFANIKLFNKFIGKPAPKTVHFPSGQTVRTFTKHLGTCLLTRSTSLLKVFVFVLNSSMCLRRQNSTRRKVSHWLF